MKTIAVTLGDPSGIGPEIVLKSLTSPDLADGPFRLLVFGHAELLKREPAYKSLSLETVQLNAIEELPAQPGNAIYCYCSAALEDFPPVGTINATAGKLSYRYIVDSIEAALAGKVDVVATAPINKEALQAAAVPYLDHTAMFTQLTRAAQSMTLFITGPLRVFFLTRHIPFRAIADSLDTNEIISTLHHCNRYLQQLGISTPRLAVAALNPHAGEHGLFGSEEEEIIRPAVQQVRAEGLRVSGPIAADSVFQLCKEGHFDAVLSLYHDQGHIAAKTYDFYGTVSLTMGLPFLRTSVDHGTALEIAGQDKANATSMIKAIEAAAQYAWPIGK